MQEPTGRARGDLAHDSQVHAGDVLAGPGVVSPHESCHPLAGLCEARLNALRGGVRLVPKEDREVPVDRVARDRRRPRIRGCGNHLLDRAGCLHVRQVAGDTRLQLHAAQHAQRGGCRRE